MTKRDFVRVTTCAAIFGLVGGATFEGTNYLFNKGIAVESSQKKIRLLQRRQSLRLRQPEVAIRLEAFQKLLKMFFLLLLLLM